MAIKLSRKKPNFANSRSHALNITKKKQSVNLQKVTVNGETVLLSAREARSLKKNDNKAQN